MDEVSRTRGVRRKLRGVVIHDGSEKTVAVRVEQRRRHPLYGKVVRQVRRLLAHDEANEAKVGDKVTIVECRPYSRHKHWRVIEVMKEKTASAQ